MVLKVVHSTENCKDSSCPTIYQDETGNFVIQGFMLKPEHRDGINIPEGEDAVLLPAEFLHTFIENEKRSKN